MTDIFSEDKGGGEAKSRKRPSSGISGMIKRRNETHYMHRERERLSERDRDKVVRASIYSENPFACRFQLIEIHNILFSSVHLKPARFGILYESLKDSSKFRISNHLSERM